MINDVLINFLSDKKIDIKRKKLYLERLNLSYSDIFELKQIFAYDEKLYQVLHGLTYFVDSAFYAKLEYQNNKIKKRKAQKRLRKEKNKNDKHKRR